MSFQCTDLLEHLSETCSTASQHRQILLDITRLSSTKLRSRDDAENLLSSRVPTQAQNPALSATPSSSEALAANEPSQDNIAKPTVNSDHVVNTLPSGAAPRDNAHAASAASAQSSLVLQNQDQSQNQNQNQNQNLQMNPGNTVSYDYQQMSTQINGLAPYSNPFMTQAQPTSFLGGSNGFTSTFDFGNDSMSMPFSLNPSTNQADLAFWREMPIGEDAGEWGFFTDQYANTLLSSLPSFSDTYNTQI